MPSKLRLLILSAGGAVAQNFVDALGSRRSDCVLIGTNSIAGSATLFRMDAVYLAPPAASGEEYLDCIAQLIKDERADLVIPARDDDVLALAALRERSPGLAPLLLAGSVRSARMMIDKVGSAHFARRHGLSFAATGENVQQALELAQRYPLPLIGKPRTGNGSQGVVLMRSTAEIVRAFERSPDLIAQPFLDPPDDMDALVAPFDAGLPLFFSLPGTTKLSVQVTVGPDGAVSDAFGTLSLEVGGRGVEFRRCDDADLLEIGRAYGQATAAEGWRGPLNVQLKRTREKVLVAFELNGRFNGGTAARTLMGYDEIYDVIHSYVPSADFPRSALEPADVVPLHLACEALPASSAAALERARKWSSGGSEPAA
jgi:carbamoyl-phosphate synthase large subunit